MSSPVSSSQTRLFASPRRGDLHELQDVRRRAVSQQRRLGSALPSLVMLSGPAEVLVSGIFRKVHRRVAGF